MKSDNEKRNPDYHEAEKEERKRERERKRKVEDLK
jgi:hypothetical protein